jgi:hypothetical protein
MTSGASPTFGVRRTIMASVDAWATAGSSGLLLNRSNCLHAVIDCGRHRLMHRRRIDPSTSGVQP